MTENNTLSAVPLADSIDRLIQRITLSIGWCYVLLVLVIILQVTLRKGFSHGLIVITSYSIHYTKLYEG